MLEWKKIQETPFKAGFRRMLTRQFRLPDGRVDEFTIKNEGQAVCVVALTQANDVILVRQYRPGPELVLLELPGGAVDADENPLEAARRELLEETGYNGEFEPVGMTLDCAYSNMQRHNFIAKTCVRVQDPQPDKNEFLETVIMPLSDFRLHLRNGQLTDVESGYLCLDSLGLL